MALVNTKVIIEKANKQNSAIGAFNFVNFETLKAIVEGAKKSNTGCILSASEGAIKYLGMKNLVALVKQMVCDEKLDFSLHLDHGSSFEICKDAIDSGFTSVMIDASHYPLEENITITKQVVDYAHKKNVWVEAELGRLSGIEEHVNVKDKDAAFTNPEEAFYFISKTKADSLAIAIGTSHGAYKSASGKLLRIDILKKIRKLLPDTPIVLHGASSIDKKAVEKINKYGGKLEKTNGIPLSQLKSAIDNGVRKINVDSDIRIAFTGAVRKHLSENPEHFDLRQILKPAIIEASVLVAGKIDFFNNSKIADK